MEKDSLALEMLKELKLQSRRKDIIIIILIAVIFAMIISFFVYENQYETVAEETTQETSYTDNSIVVQSIE